ncbi:DNA repair protein rad50 [Friedmanniomyces endolithicus]|uniref:DNA repair protein RAD50 n=1 Tax=Friedmanniomyces endolithicus TaxID=329885 RepID=A0AAN6QQU7_9PEZI|nr:DNA repair protein rad50 [Friedmanniomyces endolithicus]KAK0980527.1 DNA repair protein rad50 [Friedmanniomyces endolithicus]KAK1038826.1 DNA repair protein rad50 [Friedmanniomyces endolithicus]
MSSIDKLSILGVRSFDNTRTEVIAFNKPLTLIVGPNGCGKTTIIECLKYATTGDLPPNTKGGAFVHDPALCGEKEVLAQVKLSFKSKTGTPMVCTRSLQLTVKKNTRTVHALEGNLFMRKLGEKVSLSSRVMDLNACMPDYLGVSKAVLNSVIFCHQEDSLWPLAQPKELKERFDAIFEAVKYTKAIDNIKVMQKTHKHKLDLMKKDEDVAKHNKARGKKLEKQAADLNDELDVLRASHKDYDGRIKQAARNVEAAWKQAEQANLIVGDLNGKRIVKRTKEESVQGLRESLQEMTDTDDELQRMLEQYDERVQHYEADLTEQKEAYHEMTGEVSHGRSRVSAKERECGSYEAQAEQYDRQIASREKLIKESARSHKIHGFDLELDDGLVAAFMDRITKMAREQNAKFERARRETAEELQVEQSQLNSLNQEKTTVNGRKDAARQTIVTNDRKINSVQTELNRINVDEGAKAALETKLCETEARLTQVKTENDKADWEHQAHQADLRLREFDERKEKLDAEMVEGTRQASESARLDYVRKELKERESRLETNTGAYSEKLTSLIGSSWTPATVEDQFQRTLEQKAEQVAEAERQRDGTSREKEQLDFQLNSCRRDLRAKQQAMKKAADVVRKSCDCEPDEYMHNLHELEEARDTLRSDTESMERLNAYFDACIKSAKDPQHPGCRTCGRGISKDSEAIKLIEILAKERTKLKSQLGSAPQDLKKCEEDLEAAKAAGSEFEAWERLKEKEIPAAEKEEKKLVEKREVLIEQLEQQDGVVNERQAAKRDVDAVSRTVQNIAKLNNEIAEFKAQVGELSAKQESAGFSRGLEQIQEELKLINEEARTAKASLAKINSERERGRSAVSRLELEVRDAERNFSTAEYQLKERRSMEAQIDELKGLNTGQRENIGLYDTQLQDLGPKLSQAQAKYDDTARRGADTDRELQAQAHKINATLNQLKLANQEIDSYISRGGPEQLKRGKREIEALKKEVSRLEEEQIEITRQVKQLEEHLRSHSDTRRSISDNQRYRRDLRQLEQVCTEIAELETHNAEEDKARFEAEGSRCQMERNKLAAEQATLTGAMKSKDEALVMVLTDYDTEYKDSARKYKEAHIRVETTKACIEDLGRFGGALDKAIMKYHSVKMEEINRIIDELWRKTYQGTDVDTIRIRSESETQKANKSYNYRVCMVKQEAEMDMRGRCSAGQKVLASIIIRLALAECFGINCGLLALDEPTTNLDRDNIQALARSLAEIIESRKQQRNFQLIVITHDEEFLKFMDCGDFADVYWRVGRSANQTSRIERSSINEVL